MLVSKLITALFRGWGMFNGECWTAMGHMIDHHTSKTFAYLRKHSHDLKASTLGFSKSGKACGKLPMRHAKGPEKVAQADKLGWLILSLSWLFGVINRWTIKFDLHFYLPTFTFQHHADLVISVANSPPNVPPCCWVAVRLLPHQHQNSPLCFALETNGLTMVNI